MRNTKIIKLLFILAIAGLFIASYSLYDHYQPLGKGVCNISEAINCDIVNKGPYSEFFGVPVALLGILFYLVLIFISGILVFRKEKNEFFQKILIYISGFGVIFSLSLGVFVYYRLRAVCPVCILSYITIITIFILSAKIKEKTDI